MSHLSDVEQTVLRRDVQIGERAVLSRCIVGDRVTIGARCRLRNAIVARDNHLPEGFEAGFDPELDRQRWPVSDAGILVIPRGSFPATSSRLARYKISDPIPRIGLTVRPEPNRAGRSECPQYTSQSA